MSNQIEQRLQSLREYLTEKNLGVAVIFSSDPSLSEYVPQAWQFRAWLSGFTGSAGSLIVTPKNAYLITDSRYWEQAQAVLPSCISLLKQRGSMIDEIIGTLRSFCSIYLKSGILLDPRTVSIQHFDKLQDFATSCQSEITQDITFIPKLWTDRPKSEHAPIWMTPTKGVSPQQKLAYLQQAMRKARCQAFVSLALDDIAWLLNLRGHDIDFNPVFVSEFILTTEEAKLFVDASQITDELQQYLAKLNVQVFTHEAFADSLQALEGTLLLDPTQVNAHVQSLLPEITVVKSDSPLTLQKASKNPAELAAIDEAMLLDGIALSNFYFELYQRLENHEKLTEFDVSELLHSHRAQHADFISESFETIVACGPNSAMPHYQNGADKEKATLLTSDTLLLIDSGAQYKMGTTDITRMTGLGTPTDAMKEDVGLVTNAMLTLMNTRFPAGTTGAQLDAIARMQLWENGYDFGHGTGHGVGYLLNVHEGPFSISPRCNMALPLGWVTSNEPGLYRPKQWGVRVENLMAIQRDSKNEFAEFWKFRPLTCFPIDVTIMPDHYWKSLQARLLLKYNEWVYSRLAPHLSEQVNTWLQKICFI